MSYHDPTICTAPFGPGQLVLEANPEFIKLFSENLWVSMHPGAMIELSKTYVHYKDDKHIIDVPTVVRLVPLAKELQFDLKEMLSQGGLIFSLNCSGPTPSNSPLAAWDYQTMPLSTEPQKDHTDTPAHRDEH